MANEHFFERGKAPCVIRRLESQCFRTESADGTSCDLENVDADLVDAAVRKNVLLCVDERNRIIHLEVTERHVFEQSRVQTVKHGEPCEVIAENVPGYSVSLLGQSADSLRATLQRLSATVPLTPSQIEETVRKYRRDPTRPTVVLPDADFAVISVLEEHALDFPGLIIQSAPKRSYPHGPAVAAFVAAAVVQIDRAARHRRVTGKHRLHDAARLHVDLRTVDRRVATSGSKGQAGFRWNAVDGYRGTTGDLTGDLLCHPAGYIDARLGDLRNLLARRRSGLEDPREISVGDVLRGDAGTRIDAPTESMLEAGGPANR